jgi:hypothetical protein
LKGFVLLKSNASFAFYGGYGCGVYSCSTNNLGDEVGRNAPVTANVWSMLTMTVQNGMIRYYVNGNLIADYEQGAIHTVVGNGNLPLLIGGVNGFSNRFFNGKIDDIRIYNRALSPDEVMVLARLFLSTDDFIEKNINVYPNPTTQQLTIDYTPAIQQLSIVNLLGQSLKTLKINDLGRLNVDVSDLPTGVYFLKINEKDMKKWVKL